MTPEEIGTAVLTALAKAAETRRPGLRPYNYDRHAHAVWGDVLQTATARHEHRQSRKGEGSTEVLAMDYHAHRSAVTEILKCDGDVPEGLAAQAAKVFIFAETKTPT